LSNIAKYKQIATVIEIIIGRENGERREGKGQLVDLISKH